MAMPFAPCTDDCNDEKSVQILSHVFGDVIMKLVGDENLDSVTTTNNIITTMLSGFNSGILVVGALIIIYVTLVGMANTANDGEALGKKWSSMWTPLRMVYGAAFLLPTASGFSFLQIFILVIALWGVGLANTVYKAGMATSVFSPNAIVADVNKVGDFYGVKEFAVNYTLSRICAGLVPEKYSSAYSGSPVLSNGFPSGSSPDNPMDKNVLKLGYVEKIYGYKDTNSKTNLNGGGVVCGTVTVVDYVGLPLNGSGTVVPDPNAPVSSKNESSDELINEQLRSIEKAVFMVKKKNMVAMVNDKLNPLAERWKTRLLNNETIDSQELVTIVAETETAIASDLQSLATEQKGGLSNAIEQYTSTLTEGGWLMAGGWFQRVGTARSKLSSIFHIKVISASAPISFGSRTEELLEVDNELGALRKAIRERFAYNSANDQYQEKRLDDMTYGVPSDLKSKWDTGLLSSLISTLNDWINSVMRNIAEAFTGSSRVPGMAVLCGTNGEMGGSINRMKCVGEFIVVADAAIEGVKITLIVAEFGAGATAAVIEATPLASHATNLDTGVMVLHRLMQHVLGLLAEIGSWFKILGFYFSVLLPSMPYVAFIIVGVGWLLALIQSLLVAPLWMLLHMRPNNTFVGQDERGYLILLGIFVRPVLAILGLFLACLLADPVIDFVTQAFFGMRGDIAKGGGFMQLLNNVNTFFWWMAAFALTLLPIMYMIFFLPQTLSDQILQWIGGGVRSLGDSQAIGKAQAGLAGLYGMGRAATISGGGGGASSVPKTTNPKQDSKGSSTGEDKAISGPQGVDGSRVNGTQTPLKPKP